MSARLERGLARGIERLGAMLPTDQRSWAVALGAEIAAAPAEEKLPLAASGTIGLLRIAGERVLHRWVTRPIALAAALSTGVAIGLIDVSSATRWPLRMLVTAGCVAIGVVRPQTAVISGALAGLGIAAVGRVVGAAGPYGHDAGDVWLPLIPAILLAALGGAIGREVRLGKWRSRR